MRQPGYRSGITPLQDKNDLKIFLLNQASILFCFFVPFKEGLKAVHLCSVGFTRNFLGYFCGALQLLSQDIARDKRLTTVEMMSRMASTGLLGGLALMVLSFQLLTFGI